MKKVFKRIRNLLLGLAALVLLLLVAFQVVMRPAVLTRIVNRLADDYVEGSVNFDRVKAHAIKSFPYLHLEASRFSITYPHERYAPYDSLYPETERRFDLRKAGRGETVDTLASFGELDVWFNYMAFLRKDEIHIRRLRLTRPRIFAHDFGDGRANWDILPVGSDSTEEDSGLPAIRLNHIQLNDRPFIVYTSPKDTLYGLFTLRQLALDGRIDSRSPDKCRAELIIDSLFVSGRLPADTVSLRLEHLRAKAGRRKIQLEADAQSRLRTRSFGRLTVPIRLELDAELPEAPEGETAALIHALKLRLSALELQGGGSLCRHADGSIDMDVNAVIDDCPLGEVIREYRANIPALQEVETDARLSLRASAKGTYGNGQLPLLDARVRIPQTALDYRALGHKGRIGLDIELVTDRDQTVNAAVKDLLVDILGAKIDLKGKVQDALGDDPFLHFSGTARARVDSLTRVFSEETGIRGTGVVDARFSGSARLSQLDMARIGSADIDCRLSAENLRIEDHPDLLTAFLPRLDARLATRGNRIDSSLPQGERVLALEAEADSLNLQFEDMFLRGSAISLKAQNSAEILKGGEELTPLMGILKIGSLRARDDDGLHLSLRNNSERFRITPATEGQRSPRLRLDSESGSVRVRQGADLYTLRNLKFGLSAARRPAQERKQRPDSLQRDSSFRRRARLRESDDFLAADINLSLESSMKQYVRDWDIEGSLELGSSRIVLPSFPLKTRLSDVKGSFNNDAVNLENLTLKAGASDVSAQLRLSGLRRQLLGRGRGRLQLKADVQSQYIDANELMRAYAYYSTYVPEQTLAEASDDAVEEAVAEARLPDAPEGGKLIVIPSNLEVDFTLEANSIRYDSLLVNWAAADVAMRDRTLQITNAVAASNMGDIYFEGFYATRSKKDIKAGFDLNLVDVTAEKVITLFPAIDTLMPMLTSFAGDLDCQLAATTDIDTTMNLILPSIDGMVKISGKDLQLKDSKEFTKIAGLLMFKDKKKAWIDNMSVMGVVQDNILEIFPFVLNVDRYTVAASGRQSLSDEFNYHISVIKSPLLVKFGLNAWGQDFDHIHYGLSSPKYRSAEVPVYTKQLDTVQYNLVAAIHNIFELGVEKAMAENRIRDYQLPSFEEDDILPLTEISADSLARMESLVGNVTEDARSRREDLKETLLRMEREAALRKDDEQ